MEPRVFPTGIGLVAACSPVGKMSARRKQKMSSYFAISGLEGKDLPHQISPIRTLYLVWRLSWSQIRLILTWLDHAGSGVTVKLLITDVRSSDKICGRFTLRKKRKTDFCRNGIKLNNSILSNGLNGEFTKRAFYRGCLYIIETLVWARRKNIE